jgi:iron complex transport system substrate-binding protein
VPELVSAAGGTPVLADPGERSRAVEWSAIADADPQLIIVAPCGFALEGAAQQAGDVLDRLPPKVPVWAVDGNSYIVRPGPRLVDGVELIASILHPSLFGAPPDGRAERVR